MNETWPGMANANSCVYVPNCLKGNWPELHREGEREGKKERANRVHRPNQTVCGFVGLICCGWLLRVTGRGEQKRERNAREHFERV